ncbi:hypothetical protein JHK82_014331 [Glycine max]|uniref:Uncharacterized protein n=2 Tax=Glycine subgen. Soja TaxID=1462606 RepID=A0A0R0JBU2_SOYBN|nr:hypothetical protein JHK87_014241 [Glycine soja]KAG5030725.1 hypothetical protein JHK85_014707 [Glycine max]KAG5044953.1 hypothetical protein JHK86_014359 [Glycine max]KAG5147450.1 hypothetical protein JHK82_014331 [Glycine max]KAH1124115.1 hypothetical protein GYH30_014039 [Glycine max]
MQQDTATWQTKLHPSSAIWQLSTSGRHSPCAATYCGPEPVTKHNGERERGEEDRENSSHRKDMNAEMAW